MPNRSGCFATTTVCDATVFAGSTFLDAASCIDPQPIDVLHLHGTHDDTVPYPRNLPPDDLGFGVDTIGAEATVARWAELSSCDEELQLIERLSGFVRPRPALSRFALGEAQIRDVRTGAA